MAFTRRNVWELGGDWGDPILWYARGIKALTARPLGDPTSWRFYGGTHGIDAQLWQQLGYLSSSDPAPSKADTAAALVLSLRRDLVSAEQHAPGVKP
jgi:tyrosinase